MSLTILDFFKKYFFRFIFVPHALFSILFVTITAVSLMKMTTLREQNTVRESIDTFRQLLLSGDIINLEITLKSVARGMNWKEASILHPNGIVLASYPNADLVQSRKRSEDCNYFHLIKDDSGIVGNLCWIPNPRTSVFFYIFVLILLAGVSMLVQREVSKLLVKKLASLIDELKKLTSTFQASVDHESVQDYKELKYTTEEANSLNTVFQSYLEKLRKRQQEYLVSERSIALGKLAQQVAHDIRSPLTALDFATHDLSQLDEPRRNLIRNATKRIHDIANNLLQTNRDLSDTEGQATSPEVSGGNSQPVLLSSCLEMIVSEKRMQFQDQPKLEIDLEIQASSYGAFANLNAVELKRVISNLINNSAEALRFSGKIQVGLRLADRDQIEISVNDNGPGIPEAILKQLGERGVSYGKDNSESGSGLGVHHAKQSIDAWNGSLSIETENDAAASGGTGTNVRILLPKTEPPTWFVPRISLGKNSHIVIFDDDDSIHEVWQNRFDSIGALEKGGLAGKQIKLHKISCPKKLCQWVKENSFLSDTQQVTYLCDYEIQGQKENGLDLIEHLGIKENSILVTSRFEEEQVLQRSENLGVKCLPKNLAQIVPIHFNADS